MTAASTVNHGGTEWAFSGGWIPSQGVGHEPEMTSRDELCLLNASERDACARVTFYYDDRDPVGPYEIRVPAARLRHIRINDLIDPEAVPLDQPYGFMLQSDSPVIVQIRHTDTRSGSALVTVISAISLAERSGETRTG